MHAWTSLLFARSWTKSMSADFWRVRSNKSSVVKERESIKRFLMEFLCSAKKHSFFIICHLKIILKTTFLFLTALRLIDSRDSFHFFHKMYQKSIYLYFFTKKKQSTPKFWKTQKLSFFKFFIKTRTQTRLCKSFSMFFLWNLWQTWFENFSKLHFKYKEN